MHCDRGMEPKPALTTLHESEVANPDRVPRVAADIFVEEFEYDQMLAPNESDCLQIERRQAKPLHTLPSRL